jgi:hypothetical protein
LFALRYILFFLSALSFLCCFVLTRNSFLKLLKSLYAHQYCSLVYFSDINSPHLSVVFPHALNTYMTI